MVGGCVRPSEPVSTETPTALGPGTEAQHEPPHPVLDTGWIPALGCCLARQQPFEYVANFEPIQFFSGVWLDSHSATGMVVLAILFL